MIYLYFICLILFFAILLKCASFLIDGAVWIAKVLNIPKMIVGIVFVGLATTAPEFGVSVIAAIQGLPEMALGNAIGSVICDDGVALGLAAILAPTAIKVNCRILKGAGFFLLSIDILAFLLARNGTIGRVEGLAFIVILGAYFTLVIKHQGSVVSLYKKAGDTPPVERDKNPLGSRTALFKKPVFLFIVGIIGVALTSEGVVWAAKKIAFHFSVPETIIALTVIALGTSLPEISTCITAALKGEGEIAVGDIIGADILNILWIIGASSIANPIKVEPKLINFSFPFMILVVTTMLVSMRIGCRLGKAKGFLLIGLYIIYLFLIFKLFT